MKSYVGIISFLIYVYVYLTLFPSQFGHWINHQGLRQPLSPMIICRQAEISDSLKIKFGLSEDRESILQKLNK